MNGIIKCTYSDCQEDWNDNSPSCLCGEPDFRKCENYIGEKEAEKVEVREIISEEETTIPWNSSAMGSKDLEFISVRMHPFIIGVIGQSKSGKTTFLATLYMLLRGGKSIGNYTFAGSYTLLGWEKIAHFLTFNTHKKISFPPHTSANMTRVPGLLHILLKDEYGNYKDVILTDAPGEWFTDWAKDSDGHASIGAKWVDEVSDAFILIADSAAFKSNLGRERHSLMQLVERIKNTHDKRPTALAWTKSDYELDEEIKEKLSARVVNQLSNVETYRLAVINRKSEKEIEDILKVIENLLKQSAQKKVIKSVPIKNEEDFFFTIR